MDGKSSPGAAMRPASPGAKGRVARRLGADEPYRSLYENLPFMYFVLAGDLSIVSVNRFGAEQLGYSAAELVGQPVQEIIHPDDHEGLEERLCDACGAPDEAHAWQLRKITKGGEIMWVQETSRAVRAPDGDWRLLVACEDVTERRRDEERLRRYREKLRALSAELALAEERERRRIGAGLHDNIGQLLGAVLLKLGELEGHVSRTDRDTLEAASGLVASAIEQTRSLIFDLTSPVLDQLGFEAALKDLAEHTTELHGLPCLFESDGREKPLADDSQLVLLGVVRELLWNVAKHARARQVTLSVVRQEGSVVIAVHDDGIGFEPEVAGRAFVDGGGFGLFSARERLTTLGGDLAVASVLGEGSTVQLSVPLTRPLGSQQ